MFRKWLVYLILAIVAGLSLPQGQLTAATPTVASIQSHTEHSRLTGDAARHGHLPAAINPTHHLPTPLMPAVEAEVEQEQEVSRGKEYRQVKRIALFSERWRCGAPGLEYVGLLHRALGTVPSDLSLTILYRVFRL